MTQKHGTGIEWTHLEGTKGETWNPVVGCSLASPGCTNCYAMDFAGLRLDREGGPAHYRGTTKVVNGKRVWTGHVALAEHKLIEPLRWTKPRTIFVNSMGDVFHEDVPDEWIDRVFAVMSLAPQHTFIVLTKRAERMRKYFAEAVGRDGSVMTATRGYGICIEREMHIREAMQPFASLPGADHGSAVRFPLPNVWLGISCEDQTRADERVIHLLATPAAVRLVSGEPLLGGIDFTRLRIDDDTRLDALQSYTSKRLEGGHWEHFPNGNPSLDWVIVGGESGSGARPMHPGWARSIRDQCKAAKVPFFFKQHGEYVTAPSNQHLDREHIFLSRDWDFVRVGKKAAGRLLDGREHVEFPRVVGGGV